MLPGSGPAQVPVVPLGQPAVLPGAAAGAHAALLRSGGPPAG
jgi:hypothetical protein